MACGFLVLTAPGTWAQAVPDEAARGREVYENSKPKCSMCHKINGSGGKAGPDLSDVGSRRTAEWLSAYLRNPKAENPKNKMPPVRVTDADLRALIAYLRSLTRQT